MSRLRLAFFFFLSISAISWLASASATLYEEPLILNKPKLLPELSSELFCNTGLYRFLFRLPDSCLPMIEIILKGILS